MKEFDVQVVMYWTKRVKARNSAEAWSQVANGELDKLTTQNSDDGFYIEEPEEVKGVEDA